MTTEEQAACGVVRSDAPVVDLTLVGSGESLLRMEKRLHCAAAGAGLKLKLRISKDAKAHGIPFAQTPAVLLDGGMVMSGLPRTEEIEAWLRQIVHMEKQVGASKK